ncbi:doublecortin domain-containing protein 2B isoform X2 [Anolis carolinensis]|uniref:Doublecortin domain containing 2B n=1 Tax=Anolis carolinensis TaxID=28377 RepID=H9GSL6_ANOCA|nr:PREDICTED: doublecortin domain-containing protein 2B isoform X1 [Anolis carolinensis]|eukprot:XP_008120700.1 PREDICTED: doublecortin domain-containing protein 2B isoform X1 [Anolis carolinensis]
METTNIRQTRAQRGSEPSVSPFAICGPRPMGSGRLVLAPPARNVVVYRNGDPFFKGRRLVVSQRRFLTFEAFLNEVTGIIQAPAAVRSIYTPRHGHRVNGLEGLENGQHYVAGGFERFRRLDYLNPEMKPLNRKMTKDRTQDYPGISQRTSGSGQWRRPTNLPCIIHIFRNGDLLSPPFRLILNKSLLQDWGAILELLSEKANLRSGAVRKLYKLNGEPVHGGKELISGDYYVAVGLEPYKNLPYFELLVPPKMVLQSFRNFPNNRRWTQNQGIGKLLLLSQDGCNDSEFLEPPQQDPQPAQSTGAEQAEKAPIGPTAASLGHKPSRRHQEKEASVFHAKAAQTEGASQQPRRSMEQERSSVYKRKGALKEVAHAPEVGEDEDTQVELPLDQKDAETVEEEVIPKTKPLPRKKVEPTDKVQAVHPIRRSAGDPGQEVTQKYHFLPTWGKAAASEK